MINNFAILYAMGMFSCGIGGYNENDNRGKPSKWTHISWFLATILLVFISIHFYKQNRFYEVERLYHSIVIRAYEEPRNDKYGRTIEIQRYLIIQFDSVAKPFEILVSTNTYFSKKRGDKVSFYLSNRNIYQALYRREFTRYVFVSTFEITYLVGYLLSFFFFGIPLIRYQFGKDSYLYKHEEINF